MVPLLASSRGWTWPAKALGFEDKYITTCGQLYELMAEHDRFVADLRPLMRDVLTHRGEQVGICCHFYDMCTELIACRCGITVSAPQPVTDWGRP